MTTTQIKGPWGLHWFRRDLRVAGNPALQWSWKHHKRRVVGLFCFDSKFLSRPDFSHNRFAFFLKTLRILQDELRSLGGDLLVVDSRPHEALPDLIRRVTQRGGSLPAVSYNRDYEPFARERDEKLANLLEKDFGIVPHTERDHILIEPHEITRDGEAYKVYTPFSRKWFERFRTDDVQARVEQAASGLKHLKALRAERLDSHLFSLTWKDLLGRDAPGDALADFETSNGKSVTIPIPEAGSLVAYERLLTFEKPLAHYTDKRDFPAIDGTSKLSLYFKNGSLTPALAIAALGLDSLRAPTQFLKELIWREFYYAILWHNPHVEAEAFQAKYRDLAWENDRKLFEAWKKGETGYPIVDAGMRQLNETGWMHNRVRMIVASFLTKDLLIDWRWGERYFMKQLLDGDLAPNNGGWQWAASTGCDPQPYFRIFNPELQSQRFDPEGEYIRTWIPELRGLSAKDIHAPPPTRGYPAPIVNHAAQKMAALRLFK